MKSLNTYIQEKLVINKSYKSYKYHPKTPEELREIILDRYKKEGSGTKNNPIDFNDIDVSGMTTFYNENKLEGIFEKTNFEYIDISQWDVSNVENMRRIFFKCEKLESVGDLSKWDVSNVKDMRYMFANSAIINIPEWYDIYMHDKKEN